MRRHGSEKPAKRRANDNQPPHGLRRFTQGGKVQGHSALEQDDGDRHPNGGLQQRAEIIGRVQEARCGTDDQADHGEQHNGGDLEPPGGPLSADARHQDQRDLQHETFGHPRPSGVAP